MRHATLGEKKLGGGVSSTVTSEHATNSHRSSAPGRSSEFPDASVLGIYIYI